MPFIEWIDEIFTEADAPYELSEIVQRLQTFWNPSITDDTVYRALVWLREQPPTALMVKPLNPGATPFFYSCQAARRIARRIANSKTLTCPFHLPLDIPTDSQNDSLASLKKVAIQQRRARALTAKAA